MSAETEFGLGAANDYDRKFDVFSDAIGEGNIFASTGGNILIGSSEPTGTHRAMVLNARLEERYIAALARENDPDVPPGLGIWKPEQETEVRDGYKLRLYPSRAPVWDSGSLDKEQIKDIATGLSDAVLALDGVGIDPIRPWNIVAGHVESDLSLFSESKTVYEIAGFERPLWRSERESYKDIGIDLCTHKRAGGDAYLFIYDTAFMMPGLWRDFTEDRTDAAPYRLRNIRSWAITIASLPSIDTGWSLIKGLSTSVSVDQFTRTPTWHESIRSMVVRLINTNRDLLPDWDWEALVVRTEDDCIEEFSRIYRLLHNGVGITWRGPVRPMIDPKREHESIDRTETVDRTSVFTVSNLTETVQTEENNEKHERGNDKEENKKAGNVPNPISPFDAFLSYTPSPSPFTVSTPYNHPPSPSPFEFSAFAPQTSGGKPFSPFEVSVRMQDESAKKMERTNETSNEPDISDEPKMQDEGNLTVKERDVETSPVPSLEISYSEQIRNEMQKQQKNVSDFERLRIRDKIRSVAGLVFNMSMPEDYYDELSGEESSALLDKAGWSRWESVFNTVSLSGLEDNSDDHDSKQRVLLRNVWTSCYALTFSGVSEFVWRNVVCVRNTDEYGRISPDLLGFFRTLKGEMDAIYAKYPRAEAETVRRMNDTFLVKTARFYVEYRKDFPFLDGADPYAEDALEIADMVSRIGLENIFWAVSREWSSDPVRELKDMDRFDVERLRRLCTEPAPKSKDPILSWDAYSDTGIAKAAEDALSKYGNILTEIDEEAKRKEEVLKSKRNAPLIRIDYSPFPEIESYDPLERFYKSNPWACSCADLFDHKLDPAYQIPIFDLGDKGKCMSKRHWSELFIIIAVGSGVGIATGLMGIIGSESPIALGITLGGISISIASLLFTMLF